MQTDISPKVLKPFVALVACGVPLTALGSVLPNRRLGGVGLGVLLAGVVTGGLGWAARDPQREPYLESGFEEPEPEPAEHQALAEGR